MIAVVLSKFWRDYYASSPYNNLLNAEHPRFKIFETTPWDIQSSTELQEQIKACEAVVVDDVCSPALSYIKTNGPKLCIGGDLHAHDRKGVEIRTREFEDNDYVLTGGMFAPQLKQYHYIEKHWYTNSMIYLPNSVPMNKYAPIEDQVPWWGRTSKAQIAGSMGKEVYPYRAHVANYKQVEKIKPGNHGDYFRAIAQYKMGITCNSVLDYVVAKYYEIPWVGSLLIAPPFNPVERELLGFAHDKNCYFVSQAHDVPYAIERVLNDESYGNVAKQGRDFVRACHTVTSRLDYIALVVDMIMRGNFKSDDATYLFQKLREKQQN